MVLYRPVAPYSLERLNVTDHFVLKGCSKCHGDMSYQADHHGAYYRCIQCGAVHYLDIREVDRDQPAHNWSKPDRYGRQRR